MSVSRLLALAAVGLLADGCGQGAKAIGSSGAEIQGGGPDPGDDAVGLLYIGGIAGSRPSFCTATLVDPSVILTAAHCILSPQATYTFYTGPGTPGPIAAFGPASVAGMTPHTISSPPVVHPTFTSQVCPDTSHDIALLQLDAAIDGVTPIPWSVTAEPAVGTSCTIVGFGASADGGQELYGAKRAATAVIAQVLTDSPNVTVSWGSGIADSGDSGGPLLFNGVIIGTTSCHHPDHSVEYYSRVDDGVAGWIQTQVDAWDSAIGSGNGTDGGSGDEGTEGGVGDDGGDGDAS